VTRIERELKAFREGYGESCNDYVNGTRARNPYLPESVPYLAWSRGYNEARRQIGSATMIRT
jgi:hypothetical protein